MTPNKKIVTLVTYIDYYIYMGASYSKNQLKITLALYKLLFRKPIEKITVSEICAYAGVSRMSFYRNFSSLEDIFIKYSDDRFEEFYEIIRQISDPTGYEFYLALFQYLKKYSRQVQALRKANRESLLINQFKSYTQYLIKKLDEKELSFININPLTVPFISGGIYSVLMSWVDDKFNTSPEDMTRHLIAILSNQE